MAKKAKPRVHYYQREVINNENLRGIAVNSLNRVCPEWRGDGKSMEPPKNKYEFADYISSATRSLCEAIWDDVTARAMIETESGGKICSVDDLQRMFVATKSASDAKTWFRELVNALKKPSGLLKTAIENEKAGRGPFGSLPRQVQNARNMDILEFMRNSPW